MGWLLLEKKYLIIAVLLAVFSMLSFASIATKSATFDEVQNYGIGKYLLQNQKWDVMGSIMSPPLAYYLSSLPLLLYAEDPTYWEYKDANRDVTFLSAVDAVRGQGLLSGPLNAGDRLLILSRLTTLLLSLLLGYFIYRFSAELYGAYGGALSLFLFALCPNMLAHSGLITTDMPFTAFSFIAVYYFRAFLHKQCYQSALFAGGALGLALASKFTALLLIPLLVTVYAVYQIRAKKRFTLHLFVLFGVAALLFLASYGFHLEPFYQGNERRLAQIGEGFSTFLHGSYSVQGWWYFYPVAFFLKTPLPLLLLFTTALAVYWQSRRESWFDFLVLFLPIAGLFLVFSSSNVSIGVRYLLPVYPFIFVMIGRLSLCGAGIRKMICLLAVWYVGGTLFIAPHFLAYFNETVGGPKNGYKYLVDSNLDWGQDLKGLKKYLDEQGIKRISLSYFGIDSPGRYGIDYDWLPSHHLYNPTPEKPVDSAKNRFVAISATNLQGIFMQPRDMYHWLKNFEPAATIGYSIFVYDLHSLEPVK